jgi:hypothetical protein
VKSAVVWFGGLEQKTEKTDISGGSAIQKVTAMAWPPIDLAVAVVPFLRSMKYACCRSRRMETSRRQALVASPGKPTDSTDLDAIRFGFRGSGGGIEEEVG